MIDFILNQMYGSHYILMGFSVLGVCGIGAAYKSYKTFIELKNLRDLEFKKVNLNLDKAITEYDKYHENLQLKHNLLNKKNKLNELIALKDLDTKRYNSLILQNNEQLERMVKKLEHLTIKLEKSESNIERIYKYMQEYVDEYSLNIQPLIKNANIEALFDLSLVKYYNKNQLKTKLLTQLNLDYDELLEWKNVLYYTTLSEERNLINLDLRGFEYKKKILLEFMEKRININDTIKFLPNFDENLEKLETVYWTLWNKYMDHANILLKNEVYFINEELTCLDLKEKEFLDVHKAFLPYLNQYKTPKIFVLDEHYEERRTDLFKNTIWKTNELNQQYLNSNHTYFWLSYDEFWTNLKHYSQTSNTIFSLNLVDSKIMVPEYKLTHLDPFELDDLYLRLNVFAVKIFLVTHLDTLKLFIPFVYAGFIGLVSYILYKKFKFWYNCYKTKTVKVTFLNWLLDPEILFTTSKLGIFYGITILVLLGVLYNFSGFGYWFTFMFCGRVFIWNWIKWGIYKLNKKYEWFH